MESIDIAIQSAVTETLENLAFMEVFPVTEGLPPIDPDLTAAILLHEPHQGEIRIAIPPELLAEISQTIFGLPEEGMALPAQSDLLAEILNTVAGRFLIELLPEDQPFRIGLPELNPPSITEKESLKTWHFRADDHCFTISLSNLITAHSLRTGV